MKIQIHESAGPLLRGIGLTIILMGTIAGAIHAKTRAEARNPLPTSAVPTVSKKPNSAASPQDNNLQTLTQEVAELRETVQEETVVEDVLTSSWFEIFGFIGSTITAASFYAEWLCKRSKPFV